ncbi:MAG: hypothetical protein FJ087_02020 [Deltaproteobacteria bacterium]|nr:hypothetical protein [Deltaproteobacteria bacterium]
MYLSSQWVIARDGAEGVNVFHYHHGPIDWSGVPPEGIPYEKPGALVAESVVVPPPGNRVRAYLDISAPDDADWTEIQHSLVAFVAATEGDSLPWEGIHGRCFFRVELEHDLAADWRRALGSLIEAARRVLSASSDPAAG